MHKYSRLGCFQFLRQGELMDQPYSAKMPLNISHCLRALTAVLFTNIVVFLRFLLRNCQLASTSVCP